MEYRSIGDLIEEVNEVVRKPDSGSLRRACIRHVQAVYQKVGLDKFRQRVFWPVEPQGNTIVLPNTVYKVEDVRYCGVGLLEKTSETYFQSWPYQSYLGYALAFAIDGNKIRLSSPVDEVLVVYLSLPIDSSGELLVDSRIYDAAVNYCQGQLLLAKGSNVKQDYATLNAAREYIYQAKTMIDEARGAHSGMSIPSLRDYYASIHGY